MTIEEQVPLAPFTTFRIGGEARFFVRIREESDLTEALLFARERELPVLVIGGGSNLLIDDEGWSGLVLKMELKGITYTEERGLMLAHAAAGEEWDALVDAATERGLWGMENLSGIPGTVGAAPVQNIGAYGGEAADTVVRVLALDTQTMEMRTFSKEDCAFGYRTSTFKENSGRYIITHVTFALHQNGAPNISYRDLQEYFKENTHPTLGEIRSAILSIRARKFPNLAEEGTAGSFFLNPIVSPDVAGHVAALLPGIPQFPESMGIKLPLAYMFDKGLGLKGFKMGGARLFEKQPLVVAAAFGTTSSAIQALAKAVQEKVRAAYGIEIEPEVKFVHEAK